MVNTNNMDSIEKAFLDVDRVNFVPDEAKDQVAIDAPLPIGFGQTISQPTTVKMMLEWLEPQSGDQVLDVGSGSGWAAALLANIIGPRGRVYAVELIPELVQFGRDNCAKAGIKNVTFYRAGGVVGLPEHAPYDKILVSAAAQKLPKELLEQLKIDGKLVIPIKNDILEITKNSQSEAETVTHPGFSFVPLVV